MTQFYRVEETSSLKKIFEEIDGIQARIESQKPIKSAILEGSTLTKGETYFFLREGLTVEG